MYQLASLVLLTVTAPAAAAPADRVTHFVRRLDTGSLKVRAQAAFFLGRLRDPRAIPALVSALAHGEQIVRATAAISLRELKGPLAAAALVQALGDRSAWVRAEALRGVGLLGQRDAWKRALTLLSDSDLRVRWEAARALGGMSEKGALLPLARIVERAGPAGLRGEAWRSLRRLRALIAVDEMAFLLRSAGSRSGRAQAAILLAARGEAHCVPPLREGLGDRDPHVRSFVVRALGRLPDPRAREALQRHTAKETDPRVRALIAKALRAPAASPRRSDRPPPP